MKRALLGLLGLAFAFASSADTYILTDLGAPLGPSSDAHGINNQGQVVGYWNTPRGAHAFLYDLGKLHDLGSLGGARNYALSINNNGKIVGFSDTADGVRAFAYENGIIENLGPLGGVNSYAYGINDFGYVVGQIDTSTGARGFLCLNGGLTDLGTLGGTNSFAFGINNSVQVAGSSFLADNRTLHAFLWQDGFITNLNRLLPADSGWELQEARGINNSGELVGWGIFGGQQRAFLYHSAAIVNLGILPGGTNSYALGVNNSSRVVGASSATSGLHAFVWQAGIMSDLNDLLLPGSGWELREARGINDLNQIVGWGEISGEEHAFLLTPGLASSPGPKTASALGATSGDATMATGFHPLASGGITISITSPTNTATFTAPTNLTIAATATDTSGSVTQVLFFAGPNLLATDISSPYSIVWSNAPVGGYALTAVASDDAGFTATSSVVNITISTNVLPAADAYVKDGTSSNLNFGTSIVLETRSSSTNGGNRDTYFKFDLSNFTTNISSASLNFFASLSATGTNAMTVYSVTNTSWGETTITWSNKPTRVTALITNKVAGTNWVWYSADVTSYIRSEKAAGRSVVSLSLHNPTNVTQVLSADSRENTTNKPTLLIFTTNLAPIVSITSPTNNAAFPGPTNLTINASALDGDGTIVQVQFYAGKKLIGTDASSPYGIVWSNAPAGTYSLTAVATDNAGLSSTSSVVNITVAANLSALADASVKDGSFTNTNFGTDTTMDTRSSSTNGGNRDTYLKFDFGSLTNVSSAMLNVFGNLSASGTINMTVYSSTNGWAETNITWNNKPARITALRSNTVSGTAGAAYTFDVTSYVRSENAAGRGIVSFALHNPTNVTQTFTVNSRENVTNRPVLIIQTTNSAPVISIVSPTNNTPFATPANIPINISAGDDGSVTRVELFQGSTGLAVFTNAPYTLTWSNVTAGSYALTARATDDWGVMSTSSVVNVIVETPPSVTLTNPLNNASFVAGGNITLGASASDADGTVSQVQFFQGPTNLGSDSSSPYSVVWSSVPGGSYALTARATDNNGLVTTSSVVNITVAAPPTVSITSPTNNSLISGPANVSLSATASDIDGTVTRVQFFQGTTSLGIVSNAPYSVVWSNAAIGNYALTAVATDNSGMSATSSVVNITLTPVPGVSSLRVWLKADAITGLTNAQPVTTWSDSSGWANNATQSSATYKPGYFTNVVNGKPVIRFDGTNDYFSLPNFMTNFTGAEMFVVLRATTNTPITAKRAWTFGTSTRGTHGLYPDVDGIVKDDFGHRYQDYLTPPIPITSFHFYDVYCTADTIFGARFNGLIADQWEGAAFTNTTAPRIGSSTASFDGDMAEILIYNRGLTEAERDSMAGYLGQKYALFPTPPSAPVAIAATALSGSQVQIYWRTNAQPVGGTEYVLERKTAGGAYAQIAVTPNLGAYMDAGLASNTQYFYRVKTRNYAGESDYSAEASVTTFATSAIVPTTNVDLWFSADTPGIISGFTDGQTVTTWFDNTGRNRNGTGSAILATNGLNGWPVVQFVTNASSAFQLPDYNGTAPEDEMFIVLKVQDRFPAEARSLAGLGGSPVQTFYGYYYIESVFYPNTDGSIWEDFGSRTVHYIPPPATPIDQYHLYNVRGGADEWMAKINGQTVAYTNVNTFGFDGTDGTGSPRYLGLGKWVNTFAGSIAEFVTFNRRLTTEERVSFQNYLNRKYAFATESNAPFALMAEAITEQQVFLSWQPNITNFIADYEIERKTGAGGTYSQIARVTDTTRFCDGGLTPGTTYYYRVRANYFSLETPYASEVSVTTPAVGAPNLPFTGLALWLRPEALGNLTNGAPISLWPDSGVSNNVAWQNNSSLQPCYFTNAINGLPAARFDGTDDSLSFSNFLASFSGAERIVVLQSYVDGRVSDSFASKTAHGFFPATSLIPTHIYDSASRNGEWSSWMNGLLQYSTTNNIYLGNTSTLGNSGYGTNQSLNASVAEVLIYDHELNSSERDAVNQYLNLKYSVITTVPATVTNLSAVSLSSNQIAISWSFPSGNIATEYVIERKTGARSYAEIATISEVGFFVDNGLDPGTQYYYRIRSHNLAGDSGYSNEATATTDATRVSLPVSDLATWYRGDMGLSLSNGTVAAWSDLSGNGNRATQINSAQQPSVTNFAAGLQAVHFDGVNDYLALPLFMSSLSQAEAFAVVRATQTNGNHSLWKLGNSGGNTAYPDSSGHVLDDFGTWGLQTMVPVQSLDLFRLYNVDSGPSEWISRMNGQFLFATTVTCFSGTPSHAEIGASLQSGSSCFGGDIAEVLVFKRILTVQERDAVGAYLNDRYSLITNVPSAPFHVVADAVSSSQVVVTWEPTLANRYLVERKAGPGGVYAQVAVVRDAARFFDSNLSTNTQYFYRIRAVNFAGTSDYSVETSATTPGGSVPAPLGELLLWLKSDSQNWTNGAHVERWPDLSNARNDASQLSVDNQPFVVTNVVNGRSILRFAGTNALNLPDFFGSQTQAEFFVVWKAKDDVPPVTRGGMYFACNGDAYPQSDGSIVEDFGTGSWGSPQQNLGNPLQPLDQFHLYNVGANDWDWAAHLNGTLLLETNNFGFSCATPWPRGAIGTSSFAMFEGDIAEFLMFRRMLTAEERGVIEQYLNRRYGLVTNAAEAPIVFVATNASTFIGLQWNGGMTNATGFIVERKIGSNGLYTAIATLPQGNETNYTDANLTVGISYYYRVRTRNLVGLSPPSNEINKSTDSDGDGLSDLLEALYGTDPNNPDSDGDGLPDGWEVRYHLNPLSATGDDGASGDPDGDGVSNLSEFNGGTDPTVAEPIGNNTNVMLRLYTPLK